ncbi:MAG: flagellar basal body P-ring formation chaperone FlgA [Marinobacter sp.]|uniref:flagellar basal body P-ring formation chaperone FlgA n=1 Tax=Marinobacter sp. TaxID=50741 RepID=UPI00349FE481
MRILTLAGFVLSALFTQTAFPAGGTSSQVLEAATQFLDQFVERQASNGYKITYELGNLDSRLTLANCIAGPTVAFSGDPWRSTHPRLEISCEGERPWRIFLSSALKITGEAFVAARPLGRGDRLREEMISRSEVVINSIRRGAIKKLEDLIGMEISRPINAGTVFTPDLVSAPDAVSRGDHVIIIARSGNFSVQSRGKALGNGRIGEQVRIENLSSSRTLRARIIGPGRVEVVM